MCQTLANKCVRKSVRMIAWLKLDKITSSKNIKVIEILDKRLETGLDEEDNGWYFKCEYDVYWYE